MEGTPAIVIPGYEIQRELGRGAMGVVLAARQPALDRVVAVKVLPKQGTAPSVAARFVREVQLCVALSHPHVVKLLDAGETDEWLYLSMELVEGQSLDRVLTSAGRLPPAQLLQIMEQLADALDFVHSKDIVHRDIKPANMMLTAGAAKLMDFGLARGISSQTLTAADVVVGSPRFLSPETVRDAVMTESSDLYSLGVSFHEMATGTSPYFGMELKDLLRSIVREPIAPPSRTVPGFPESLEAVIMRLLEKDPDKRTASAAKLLEDVRAVRATPDFIGTSWATSQAQLKLLSEPGGGSSLQIRTTRRTRPSSAVTRVGSRSGISSVSGVSSASTAASRSAGSDSFVLPTQGRSRAAWAAGAAVALVAAIGAAWVLAPREPVTPPSPAAGASASAGGAPRAPDPRAAAIDALAQGVTRADLKKVVDALEREVFRASGGPRANPTPAQLARIEKARALARAQLEALPFAKPWRELTGSEPFAPAAALAAPLLGETALPLASRRRLYGALLYFSHLDDMLANRCGVGTAFAAQQHLAPWARILEPEGWLNSQMAKLAGPGKITIQRNDKSHDMYLFSGLVPVTQQEVLVTGPTALRSKDKHFDDPLPVVDLTARPETMTLYAHTEDTDRLRFLRLDFEPVGGDDLPVTLAMRILTAGDPSRGRILGLAVHRDLLPPARYRVRIRAFRLVGEENGGCKMSELCAVMR